MATAPWSIPGLYTKKDEIDFQKENCSFSIIAATVDASSLSYDVFGILRRTLCQHLFAGSQLWSCLCWISSC